MRPSEYATICPYLEQAIQDIDVFLARLQRCDETERAFIEGWEAGKAEDELPELESKALVLYADWPGSSHQAAAWMHRIGWTIAADGIDVELSKLPTETPLDAASLQDHCDSFQKAAEQLKMILAACRGEASNGSLGTSEDFNPQPPVKPKRSTEKGEGRVKLIAALTKHHKYADGSCLNLEPIGNNELARLAGVSESTASAFFKKEFKGHIKYRVACGDTTRLVTALKLLNQEFSPHLLFGKKPPNEDDRDEE